MFGYDPKGAPGKMVGGSAVEAYALLWDTLHGKDAPWSSNPVVRVVSFRRAGE